MGAAATHDLLLTLAQVAIAYVGFASVVGVISLRTVEWSAALRQQFRGLVEVGLFSVLVCVVPAALASTGLEGQALWFMASTVALVCTAAQFGARIYLARRLASVPRIERSALLPLTLATLVIQMLNVLIWRAPAPYIASVLLSLGSGTVIFLAMIYALFPIQTDDGPT